MPIPESQLQTWTARGSVTQSSETYATIRRVLEDPAAPYASKADAEIFLQGSYGNETNVYRDSDVDIVFCQRNLFYYDIDNLNTDAAALFKARHPNSAEYQLAEFKDEVAAWLSSKFPNDFDAAKGNKALHVRGSNNRRNADILVCAQHKVFSGFPQPEPVTGVKFFPRSGGTIVNFPKQHRDNLTTKHQATQEWLKPMIRVVKNIRTRMCEAGVIADGVGPSYFLEGLLYNVPETSFGRTIQATTENIIRFAELADESRLACANMQHWLVRDNTPMSWPAADFAAFVRGFRTFWNSY